MTLFVISGRVPVKYLTEREKHSMENQNKNLILARRAREENNSEDARRYYDLVRTEDPDNAEAKFFYSYYRMMDGTKGEAVSNFIALCNGLPSTMSMELDANVPETEKKDFFNAIALHLENANKVAYRANSDIGGNRREELKNVYFQAMTALSAKMFEAFGNDMDMVLSAYVVRKMALKEKLWIIHDNEWAAELRKMVDEIESKYGSNEALASYAISLWKDVLDVTGGSKICQEKWEKKFNLGSELMKKYNSDPRIVAVVVPVWKDVVEEMQKQYAVLKDKSLPEKYAARIKEFEPAYVLPAQNGCIKLKLVY